MSVARLAALSAVVSTLVCVCPAYATPGTGTLFGTDASGGNLLSIDRSTGAGTVVASTGVFPIPALAVDPTSGIMYAGQGAGTPFIYTVNPATGAATLLGDTGLGFAAVGGLDFRSDGTLFAAVNIVGDGGTGSETLATINKATGVATVIGPFGTEGMEGIAFDAAGGLWGSTSSRGGGASTPGLYRINPATAAATLVAPIQSSSGAPPSGGVVSLQFACDGTLYGGTATGLGVADGGRLITINPATGVFAFVGSVSATPGARSLGALAFQDSRCLPASKDQCKNGGWRAYGVFKNQGDCVSFVATGGKNPSANSP
jgi:hypothetical protein